MGSFQSGFGGYDQFNNNVNFKSTSHTLSEESTAYTSPSSGIDMGEKVESFINKIEEGDYETEEIDFSSPETGNSHSSGEIEGYLYKVESEGPEEGSFSEPGLPGGESSPSSPSLPFAPGFSGEGSSDGSSGHTMPFAGGTITDRTPEASEFSDASGADSLPEVPIPGVNITEYKYEDEEFLYVKDQNGYIYLMHNIDDNWYIMNMWNNENESIDFPDEFLALIKKMEDMGIVFEGFDFSKENDYFYVYTDQGDFLFNLDMNVGRFISNGNEDLEYDQIYSALGILTNQYGGYQSFLDIYSEQYLTDEMIRNMISHYFPDEEITEEQMQLLFSRMARVGCGFMSCANTMFDEFAYLTDEEWKTQFGFDRKNENGEYNYQYLFVDFFLYYQQQIYGFDTIEELLGNEDEFQKSDDDFFDYDELTGANGMDTDFLIDTFTKYLTSMGIEANVSAIDCTGDYQAAVKEALEKGQKVILAAGDIGIYFPDDLDGDGIINDEYRDGIGAHGFTITGLTDDGQWIVSTWGRQLILDPSEFDEDTYLEIFTVDYEGGK